MTWLDKLERRFGHLGIPYLINIVLAGQLLCWFVVMFIDSRLFLMLSLDRQLILHGQVWRLVSFVFMPSLQTSPLWLALELYFYWWIGNSLTRAWGDFRFTVYWLAGMLGAILSCFLTGYGSSSGLFLSLFFAFAWMWPNMQVLLFFFIAVKVKWLGWAAALIWAVQFLRGGLSTKITLLFGLAGFLLFFGKEMYAWVKDAIVSYKRRKEWNDRWKR